MSNLDILEEELAGEADGRKKTGLPRHSMGLLQRRVSVLLLQH